MSSVAASDIRLGERRVDLPERGDAHVYFIGSIHTPWRDRRECPRRGDPAGPLCRIVVDERWLAALDGIENAATLDVMYWMHLAGRDLVHQNPKEQGKLFGTFALRSPMRPNPIAVSTVVLIDRQGGTLLVRGLDCVDGTPLLDIKPCRCPMWPPN